MPSMDCIRRPISSARAFAPLNTRTLRSPDAKRSDAFAASSSGRLTRRRTAIRNTIANTPTSAKPISRNSLRVVMTSAITSSRGATPPTSHCHCGTVMNDTNLSRALRSPSVASAELNSS